MLTPLLPHMYFFHFSDTYNLGSNGSTKFLESTIILDFFLEGCSSTGSRMLCARDKLFGQNGSTSLRYNAYGLVIGGNGPKT
jgi:hypothetical protein